MRQITGHRARGQGGQDQAPGVGNSADPRANLYDEVTAKIIAELEADRFPWVQPWGTPDAAGGIAPGLPRNALTSRPYQLAAGLEDTLRHMGERGDIIWTMQRELTQRRLDRAGVEREPDGTWVIAADHVERAATYEVRQLRDRPVKIETLSATPIERLGRIDAATWLDRELASDQPTPLRDAGFGQEARSALWARRQWLVEQQLADGDGDTVKRRANALAVLQRRELLRVAGELSNELGKPFVEARTGNMIEGKLARRVDLVSGKFALVEKSREFTLVPWQPTLEKQLGNQVGGIIRADGVNWRFGRGRRGPEISRLDEHGSVGSWGRS